MKNEIFNFNAARYMTDNEQSKLCSFHYVLSVLLILTVLLIFSGCSSCSGKDEYDFSSNSEALDTYKDYLKKVRDVSKSNTKEFGEMLCEWKTVNDTVYKFLLKDSVFSKYHNEANDYFLIHDSIRNEMLRLTETWRYSYNDILVLKEKTCQYEEDKNLRSVVLDAENFYKSINENPISVCDKQSILKRYRYFLKETLAKGISSKDEMLQFIQQEDFLFRTFLSHLYEMDNEPLSDITKDTELICRNIFLSAREGNLDPKDAVVYMSMRTVRRLLQNSAECVENISRLEMKSKEQGNAYLWMIIQPFISIDQFSLATMTEQERRQFDYIISQLPKSKRFAETFDIKLQSLNYLLPQQLLKIYVLTL